MDEAAGVLAGRDHRIVLGLGEHRAGQVGRSAERVGQLRAERSRSRSRTLCAWRSPASPPRTLLSARQGGAERGRNLARQRGIERLAHRARGQRLPRLALRLPRCAVQRATRASRSAGIRTAARSSPARPARLRSLPRRALRHAPSPCRALRRAVADDRPAGDQHRFVARLAPVLSASSTAAASCPSMRDAAQP